MTKLHGIVLSVIRHNDRHNIVSLYTSERGRIALLSPVGRGKTGALRNARLAPLAIIETEINFKSNRDLQILGTFSTPNPWRNIYFDPIKAPIVIFLSEFLGRILRTAEPDATSWRFIASAINALDNAERGLANFHIAFLIRFMRTVGIEPDTASYTEDEFFDMRTAEFTRFIPSHSDYLNAEETAFVPLLAKINFRNMHLFQFNGARRRIIIQRLIKYYSLHIPISTDFKSLDILSELFA